MNNNISFWIAVILSVGALVFYVGNASLIHWRFAKSRNAFFDFNLGLPKFEKLENLFAISLVAAGTSLSTVFVFFLTAGSLYGFWLLLCPLFFALGNWIMFLVYQRTRRNGYFDEGRANTSGVTGLIPYLGQKLTGRKYVAWLLLLLSIVNLISVLVLELIVGVSVLGYLSNHAFGIPLSSAGEFGIFFLSVSLMLAYVFLGGFRAVVTSDIWQLRLMCFAVIVAIGSVLAYDVAGHLGDFHPQSWIKSPAPIILWTFILNIILGNIFIPMSQESSWQRFRAFGEESKFDVKRAVTKSVINSIVLWSGLILLAFGLESGLPNEKLASLTSMPAVLETIRVFGGNWFSILVFPLMTMAALFAMYSTADTCVSAIFYLIGYSRYSSNATTAENNSASLPTSYYISMIAILFICLSTYAIVRVWFTPTILQLIFSVFSNLVVVSPTVITTTMLAPAPLMGTSRRGTFVAISLVFGTVTFWICAVSGFVLGQQFLWLNQLALAFGLIAAIVPVLPLWLKKQR